MRWGGVVCSGQWWLLLRSCRQLLRRSLAAAGVRDSKQLTGTQRRRLAQLIREVALDCQIGVASVREIDRLNILQASLLAIKRAVIKLSVQP